MSDPGGKIGGSFTERLTQLYETVREAGPQETLDTVRRLGQELGSAGVDRFIGSFGSIAGEDKNFLRNILSGPVADPVAAAAGAKNLITRELEGQFRQRRLEVHIQDAVGHPHEAADASAAGAVMPRLVNKGERLGINPQPEPPGDFVPLEPATPRAADKLAAEAQKRALGPQPEPPDSFSPAELDASQKAARKFVSEMEKRGFNPQPEPPGSLRPAELAASQKAANKFVSEMEKRGFNPQPEPPGKEALQEREVDKESAHKFISELEKRSFDPQPEPPGISLSGERETNEK